MLTSRPRARHARRRRIPVARSAGTLAVLGVTAGATLAMAGPASAATSGDVLSKIKSCESGGDYTAHNRHSTASGAYQFLDSTWRGLSGTEGYSSAADAPPAVQDRVAAHVLATQGTTPWLASKHCWSRGGVSLTTGSGSRDESRNESANDSGNGSAAGSDPSDITRFFTNGARYDSGDATTGTPGTSDGRYWHWRDGHLYWTTHPERFAGAHFYTDQSAAMSGNQR